MKNLPNCQELILSVKDSVLTVLFNRPQKRNAMNATLVAEVMAVFDHINDDREIRAVVIRGAEGDFCAGGDISSMNAGGDDEQSAARATWQFNRNFGHMISKVNQAPQVVITLLEGAVLGGGFGLACVSDIAIVDTGAKLAMPETGLGIIPAQIAPFVVARIGLTQARRLALLGERIDGETAHRLGIAHYLTSTEDQMLVQLNEVLNRVRRCAPSANAQTKKLMLLVGSVDQDQLLDTAADYFCASMRGAEGQEGTSAFLEKRLPSWAVPKDNE